MLEEVSALNEKSMAQRCECLHCRSDCHQSTPDNLKYPIICYARGWKICGVSERVPRIYNDIKEE